MKRAASDVLRLPFLPAERIAGTTHRQSNATMFFRLFVPVAVLVICSVFLINTFTFREMANLDPGGPALFPRILMGVIAVCAVIELVRFFRLNSLSELKGSFGDLFQRGSPISKTARFNSSQRAVLAIGFSLIYPMAIIRVGFIFSTVVFITILALLFRARLWAALAVAIVVSVLFFLLFAEVLNVRVPEGAWFDVRSLLFG